MKLHLADRSSVPNRSLSISHNLYSHFLKVLHFHEQFELVYIIRSTGIRFIGDSIERFEPGDLVLIGSNLSHLWLNDEEYFDKSSTLKAEAVAIHFRKDFLGKEFLEAPEFNQMKALIEQATNGIKFTDVAPHIVNDLKTISNLGETEGLLKLLEILNYLSKLKSYQVLSSDGYVNNASNAENKRLAKMYEFIFANFTSPISANDLAQLMSMNNSAFSRLFKRIHRKPFTRYLNEIRIGYACKLLLTGETSMSTICFKSGFNNISNFNRQFKVIKGMSPTTFLNSHGTN